MHRQAQVGGSASCHVVFERQGPAVPPDNGRADRQTETEPSLLGREERFEQFSRMKGADTSAIILHRYLNAVAYSPGLDQYDAPGGLVSLFSLHRIHDQVENDL